MPRQTNEFYYLYGPETPHSHLLLDGRTRKATHFVPPRNRRLEASEGGVLSAEDAAQLKALTGVDEVQETEAMRTGNWLSIPDLRQPPPVMIYTLYSPGEGSAQNRHELIAANTAILNDPWDGRFSGLGIGRPGEVGARRRRAGAEGAARQTVSLGDAVPNFFRFF